MDRWRLLCNALGLALIVAASRTATAAAAGSPAAADGPGTIGVGFGQLYAEAQANRRGPLVVLQVVDGLPGSKAGIQKGDIIEALNGTEVAGRDLADLLRKEIRGPAGSTLRLKRVTLEGEESEISLTRVPFPPHTSRETDPFTYLIPGSWRTDPRYSFPLPWAPDMSYRGWEDLAFSPEFDDTASPEYHSYLFFWWLEGSRAFTAERLQTDMIAYFRGLAGERGRSYTFTPDLGKVSARYEADAAGAPEFGGEKASSFRGEVTLYDTRGRTITLRSEVVACGCPSTNHTAAFFGMSLEPADGEIWKELHAIRDSFRCGR